MQTSSPHATGGGTGFGIAVWPACAILLFLPAQFGLVHLEEPLPAWANVAATLGIIALLAASSALVARWRRAWTAAVALLLAGSFFVRMLFAGLVYFSGLDFGADFFLHFGREAVHVAWQQYGGLFLLCALGILALVAILVRGTRRLPLPRPRTVTILLPAAVLLLAAGHAASPEWRLFSAAQTWRAPATLVELPAGRLAAWEHSPLLRLDLPAKRELRARAAQPPRNLILVYVESGGMSLIDSPRQPGLMPHLRQLVAEHGFVPPLIASGWVTIEGIGNSLCGTLLPFEGGGDTMAGGDHMVAELPCLPDVLHAAGYRQSFLGGAQKSFSGKGAFLSAHGYDTVLGAEDWVARRLRVRPGLWGLDDPGLFAQALVELERLRAGDEPWNLTLLTIGTHLPGFVYPGCTRRENAHVFLDAAACTDQVLTGWLHELEARGFLDADTLLVLTGDHNVLPSPEMRRLFGDESVKARRVPLVVIGENLPTAAQATGATVDLAPTILDLLGIDTNARFALGRSLLDPAPRLPYFPARFHDSYAGERWTWQDDFDCDPAATGRIPGAQPLSRCEREELAFLLREQARLNSIPIAQLHCSSARPAEIRLPDRPGENLSFMISGSQHGASFIGHKGQRPGDKAGLYLLALDAEGRVLARRHAPPADAEELLVRLPKRKSTRVILAAWWPGNDPGAELPDRLRTTGADPADGAWAWRVGPGETLELIAAGTAGRLHLDPAACRELLADDPSE